MRDIFIFLVGAFIGGVITSLWVNASRHWQNARGRISAPRKAKEELQEKVKMAQGEYSQGWRELRTAVWQLLILVIFLAVCFIALTNYITVLE
jgi:hypothetical protein